MTRMTPAELAALIRKDVAKYTAVVKSAGIRIQ